MGGGFCHPISGQTIGQCHHEEKKMGESFFFLDKKGCLFYQGDLKEKNWT